MSTAPESTAERALLRSAGLRVTRPRAAVLSALRSHPHADAATVLTAVRTHLPQVSHQAVYDCLHVLTDAGLVRSLQLAGSAARYEVADTDDHHHLVCRGCGAVEDVPCVADAAPCPPARSDHGFLIDEAEVYYRGLCPTCRGGDDVAPAPAPASP